MTKQTTFAKRTRPVAVSSVLWRSPSAIYAVDSQVSRNDILLKHRIPPAEWCTYLNEDNPKTGAAVAEVQYYNGGGLLIVCFGPQLFEQETLHTADVLTLAHEAVHVFQRACQYVGEDEPGREVQAYAVESITRHLIDALQALKAQRVKIAKPTQKEEGPAK